MELRAVLATIIIMFYINNCISLGSAVCTLQIDYTTDRCRSADLIVNGKTYHKGSRGHICLPYLQREMYWNYGSSRKCIAWGGEGENCVNFYFSTNATIQWWIYKRTSVARTHGYCMSSFIRAQGQIIRQGTYNKVVKLPGLQSEMYWYCGSSRVRLGWGSVANGLSVGYFYDGEINWVVRRRG